LKDIYDILSEVKRRRGENFALATLVRTQGSSYRRPGARMLVRTDGETVGSLSAGCQLGSRTPSRDSEQRINQASGLKEYCPLDL